MTLNDFNSPRAVRIAKIALRGMRRDIALQDGFPPPGRRIPLSWTIMCREVSGDKELKAKMEEVQGDDVLKGKLVAYVSFSLSYPYPVDTFLSRHGAVVGK